MVYKRYPTPKPYMFGGWNSESAQIFEVLELWVIQLATYVRIWT